MVESIKKLREICQKPVLHSNTWYQRKFVRKVSLYFTWLFIHFRISGNTTSIIVLLTGLIATSFFVFGNYLSYIIGVLLLQFWYLLDHVDGELARYWKKTSAKGIFIDKLNHHVVHPLIFLFLGIGINKQFNNSLFLILGGFTAYFLLLQDLINTDKRDSIYHNRINKREIGSKESFYFGNKLFKKVTEIFYRIPGIMNLLTVAAIFSLMHYAFFFYAITFPIMILIKMIYNLSIPNDKFK